jgi:hypothetical protein
VTTAAADPHELRRLALHAIDNSGPVHLEDPDGWPALHPDALYGLAGDIVAALEPTTEADPVALLVSVLVAFGNAAGSGPHAIADHARHPARINACIVGESAKARKGTSWRAAGNLFETAAPDWYKHRVKTGLSSGEGLIAAVRDPDIGESGQEVPGTGSSDKRLLALEEEYARVLAVGKRDGSTLSAVVRSAYDTGDLAVLTKQALVASGAHISILGHITIPELRSKLSDTDVANGFANRFLYVAVRRKKLLPEADPPPWPILNDLSRRLSVALDQARHVTAMRRTEGARMLWADLYAQMAADEPTGILGSLCARPEAHTLRLSVAYALLDGSNAIDVPHLRAAWALWCYARASAEMIFDSDGLDALSRPARRLLDALTEAGEVGLDGAEQSAVFHRHLSGRDLEQARMELGDLIVTVTEKRAGGPFRSWAALFAPDGANSEESEQ